MGERQGLRKTWRVNRKWCNCSEFESPCAIKVRFSVKFSHLVLDLASLNERSGQKNDCRLYWVWTFWGWPGNLFSLFKLVYSSSWEMKYNYYSRGQEHASCQVYVIKPWLAVSCSHISCLPLPSKLLKWIKQQQKYSALVYILFALEKSPAKSHPQML